jgi:hypothetical protein
MLEAPCRTRERPQDKPLFLFGILPFSSVMRLALIDNQPRDSYSLLSPPWVKSSARHFPWFRPWRHFRYQYLLVEEEHKAASVLYPMLTVPADGAQSDILGRHDGYTIQRHLGALKAAYFDQQIGNSYPDSFTTTARVVSHGFVDGKSRHRARSQRRASLTHLLHIPSKQCLLSAMMHIMLAHLSSFPRFDGSQQGYMYHESSSGTLSKLLLRTVYDKRNTLQLVPRYRMPYG